MFSRRSWRRSSVIDMRLEKRFDFLRKPNTVNYKMTHQRFLRLLKWLRLGLMRFIMVVMTTIFCSNESFLKRGAVLTSSVDSCCFFLFFACSSMFLWFYILIFISHSPAPPRFKIFWAKHGRDTFTSRTDHTNCTTLTIVLLSTSVLRSCEIWLLADVNL